MRKVGCFGEQRVAKTPVAKTPQLLLAENERKVYYKNNLMANSALTNEVNKLFSSAAKWKEGLHLEFKASRDKLSNDLWSTYSAFANTDGGIIVLGVEDHGKVCGVHNVQVQKKCLCSLLANAQ